METITISDMVTKATQSAQIELTKQSSLKEKIIEIVGFGIEPERAELKANELIINFNSHIIKVFKDSRNLDPTELLDKLFIKF